MRVYLKKNITAYSGKDREEKVVYHSYRKGYVCIAKLYTVPHQTIQNINFTMNAHTLKEIWKVVSTGYKNDLRSYSVIFSCHNPEKSNVSMYALYIKLLYEHARVLGSPVSDLEYDALKVSPAKSVNSAISAGYLPSFGLSFDLDDNM